jgi:MYXO-CTERM domain-containing protein
MPTFTAPASISESSRFGAHAGRARRASAAGLLLVCAVCAPASALAYESEPNPFVLEDLADLYAGSEVDTGWLPSGSPLQLRFQVLSLGGGAVTMEGQGDLSWPDALTLAFTPTPGSGFFAVDTALAAVTSIQFDVAGYVWSSEIDRRNLAIYGETAFEPFLLQDAEPSVAHIDYTGASTETVNFDYTVFTGVTASFTMPLAPTATAAFEGVSWTVEDDLLLMSPDVATLEPNGEGHRDVAATFLGAYSANLDLVLTPTFSVCVVIFGCWDLVELDLPIPLAASSFEQAFPDTLMSFPLPILETDVTSYDFGEVEVGDVVNLELPIRNVGELDLEGTAGTLGSTWFSSYPEYFLAGPGHEDGMVVTFAPSGVGAVSATILLESNDPARPSVEVTLTGTGVLPPAEAGDTATDDDGGTTEIISSEVKGGCGCATPARAGLRGGLVGLVAAGALLLRRRRA